MGLCTEHKLAVLAELILCDSPNSKEGVFMKDMQPGQHLSTFNRNPQLQRKLAHAVAEKDSGLSIDERIERNLKKARTSIDNLRSLNYQPAGAS